MTYEDLLLEKKDGIATITLNAPDKMNALTSGLRKSILSVTDEIARDEEVKVVIVTGAGRGFCSGADLSGAGAEPTRRQRLEVLGPNYGAESFFKMDKPVIAAVNGAAAGAGFSLALSMDIRIASEKARFGAAFILRGLVPDCGITYWLPKLVGTAKAMELMLTGEIIDAQEALRLGIVSQVVPVDDLLNAAQEIAAKIAKNPPIPVELTKRIVYRTVNDDLARHLDLETWAQAICNQTEDSREAIMAFLEKRPPAPFKGK
jgi:2-(1,2-epoxy-1,2-dihydrophenyl)acetyl-CoA isomerase